jgi:putative membrane protein
LNDAQIAHIAVTANQLDITAARQALERSTNPEVRRFAETMIRDHEGVIAKAVELAGRLGVTPQDNETSRALASDAASTRTNLAKLSGSSFDKAYMDNEVAYHGAVISAIEDVLVPNTQNAELKQLLQAVLPALRAHQQHAQQLAAALTDR